MTTWRGIWGAIVAVAFIGGTFSGAVAPRNYVYAYDGSNQAAKVGPGSESSTTTRPAADTRTGSARSERGFTARARSSTSLIGLGRAAKAERRSLPKWGRPNSTDVLDRGNGKGQIRDYGPHGHAHKDFDFGHDHGAGDPHAHDWSDGERQPGRPIRPGE